jgi:hypothetical protein
MIRSNVTTVLHWLPAGPWAHLVVGVPDSLAPDHVLDFLSRGSVHYPLGNLLAGHRGSLEARLCQHFWSYWSSKGVNLTPPASEHIKSIASPQQ